MARKLDISVGMEEKIIELYDLDEDTAFLLRRESDACRNSFTIKPFYLLNCEAVDACLLEF